jgi:hypothetical protein
MMDGIKLESSCRNKDQELGTKVFTCKKMIEIIGFKSSKHA